MVGNTRDLAISPGLTKLLRHAANRRGILVGADGFCAVDDVLHSREFVNLRATQSDDGRGPRRAAHSSLPPCCFPPATYFILFWDIFLRLAFSPPFCCPTLIQHFFVFISFHEACARPSAFSYSFRHRPKRLPHALRAGKKLRSSVLPQNSFSFFLVAFLSKGAVAKTILFSFGLASSTPALPPLPLLSALPQPLASVLNFSGVFPHFSRYLRT